MEYTFTTVRKQQKDLHSCVASKASDPTPSPAHLIYLLRFKKSFNLRHVAASNICLFSDVSVFEPQEEKDSILASSYVNKDRRSLLVFIYIALCNMADKKYEASAKTPTFNYVFIFGEAHIYK